jgi:hypothetical protein
MFHTREPQGIEILISTAGLQKSTVCVQSTSFLLLASNWTLFVHDLMSLLPKNNRQEQARLHTPFRREDDDRQITYSMTKCLV